MGGSGPPLYRWKQKYGSLMLSGVENLRCLEEDENARLKRLVADLTLEEAMLSEVIC